MPDLDSFDVDAAFADLERDIVSVTSPPGATAAVARSRGRRRMTQVVLASAVAVALAAAGAAVFAGRSGGDPLVPADRPLPAPGVLTATSLSSATAGWTTTWYKTQEPAVAMSGVLLNCLSSTGPAAGHSGAMIATSGDAIALGALLDFGTDIKHAYQQWTGLNRDLATCRSARLDGEQTWDGGQARDYRVHEPQGIISTEHVWVVREAGAVGLLVIGNAPAEIPAATHVRVADAVAAALQDRASYGDADLYDEIDSAEVRTAGPSVSFATPNGIDFSHALEGWATGWVTGAQFHMKSAALPCRADDSKPASAPTTYKLGLGANGDELVSIYDSAGAARTAVFTIAQALTSCSSSPYDVHRVSLANGAEVVVAHGGSDVWMVADGRFVGSIVVPGAATAPPDSVSRGVGRLLDQILRHPIHAALGQ